MCQVRGSGGLRCTLLFRGAVERPGKGQTGWAGLVSVATGLRGSGGLGGGVRAWESEIELEEPPREATACARPGAEEGFQGAQPRSSLGRQSGWASGGGGPGAQPELGLFSGTPVPGVWVLFLPWSVVGFRQVLTSFQGRNQGPAAGWPSAPRSSQQAAPSIL